MVGLAGAAGAGKDSVASALTDIGFVQYALASPIKRALNAIFGWTMDNWENREWKEKDGALGFSPRRAAQTLGTEWGRSINERLWLELAGYTLNFYDDAHERAAQAQAENPDSVVEMMPHYVGMVVSDVRFENEAQWVREQGGEIWHIRRDDAPSVAAHSSEAGVVQQDADIVIYNSGTLDGLKQGAKLIAQGA